MVQQVKDLLLFTTVAQVHCYGMGLILSLGTSSCCWYSRKKKNVSWGGGKLFPVENHQSGVIRVSEVIHISDSLYSLGQILWRVSFYRNKQTKASVIKQEEGKPRDEQAGPGTGQRLHSQVSETNPGDGT